MILLQVAGGSFNTKKHLADFVRLNLNFIDKTTNSLFDPPFGKLGVMYTLHLQLTFVGGRCPH